MKIAPKEDKLALGDFKAEIKDGVLLVPSSLADYFVSHQINTALDALSFIETFPSQFGHDFLWSLREIQLATGKLKVILVEAGELVLVPKELTKPYGALQPTIKVANPIKPDSWLNEPRFKWFKQGYEYASTQTRAIPALSDTTPEELYFAVTAIMRENGIPIPTENYGSTVPTTPK